jgi:hypothetical protein
MKYDYSRVLVLIQNEYALNFLGSFTLISDSTHLISLAITSSVKDVVFAMTKYRWFQAELLRTSSVISLVT